MSDFQALTENDFLGGALKLTQPVDGYRAGSDPVLLAASVPAQSGQSVLDVGCGIGTALYCLGKRVSGLTLTGVEVQSAYSALAVKNALSNDLEAQIHTGDIQALPPELRNQTFDHVITNPPYFKAGAGKPSQDPSKELAFRGSVGLTDWVQHCVKRVAPKGHLSIIQRIERLPEVIAAQYGRMGSIKVIPFSARQGRKPHVAIIQSQKNGRGDFVMHAPFVLHDGLAHSGDKDDYSDAAKQVLRGGSALTIKD